MANAYLMRVLRLPGPGREGGAEKPRATAEKKAGSGGRGSHAAEAKAEAGGKKRAGAGSGQGGTGTKAPGEAAETRCRRAAGPRRLGSPSARLTRPALSHARHLTNRGAAVRRIELSSPRYRDLEDRSGYLGHLVVQEDIRGPGCPVQVVGDGTPARIAGLQPGDVIKAVDDQPVTGALSLGRGDGQDPARSDGPVDGGSQWKREDAPAVLQRRPLEVIRPEDTDRRRRFWLACRRSTTALWPPLKARIPIPMPLRRPTPRSTGNVDGELAGAGLRSATGGRLARRDQVEFRRVLPRWDWKSSRRIAWPRLRRRMQRRPDAKDYHLSFESGDPQHGQARAEGGLHVDGPNGLPTEGWWYASKVSRTWAQPACATWSSLSRADVCRCRRSGDRRRQGRGHCGGTSR